MTTTVTFLDVDCLVEKHRYKNGQVALALVVANTEKNRKGNWQPGEPMTCATVCLVAHCFRKGETAIKNYSENAGVLDVLVAAEVVAPTGREIDAGWTRYPVVEVLI